MEVDSDENEEKSPDDDYDKENLEKVVELRQKISDNCFDYDSHKELLNVLRCMAELEDLRAARLQMAQIFPLTPELWESWLSDEENIAVTDEEREEVNQLYERAVKDYLSVDLWCKYAEFNLRNCETTNNRAKIKNIFERGLAATGLHVTEGDKLWKSYIDFEILNLGMIEENDSMNKEAIELQKTLICGLYRRQLSCPLISTSLTFDNFQSWIKAKDAENLIDVKLVELAYERSLKKWEKIKDYENELAQNNANYQPYLEHEKSKEGSPARVQCLYERLLCDHCLNPTLWLQYIDYVENTIHDTYLASYITERSMRNCPWSVVLAQYRLNLLEKTDCVHSHITATVELALSSGLQVATDYRDLWMSFLEYMRRRYDRASKEEEEKVQEELRAAFSRAVNHLNTVENSDPECVVSQFWARIEAKCFKDLERTRLIWNDILAVPDRKTAVMWLEFINLELAYGDSKHLRKLFPRALQQVSDWPESIYSSWLNFERDEGTLESYTNCVNKCNEKILQFQARREKEMESRTEVPRKRFEQGRKPGRAGLGYRKEKNSIESKEEPEPQPRLVRKRPAENLVQQESSPEKKKKTEDIVNDLLSEGKKEHGVTIKHDSSKDNRTVFVSNLDFSTEDEIIRNIFIQDGTINDLRLVRDFKGRSKGYSYVEFEKEDSAVKALKRDRQLIGGRPMFVSKCDPDKDTRNTGFRFSNNLEKNKLFVRGLATSTTEDDLRQTFEKYGDVKSVRLVTYRNGHSKGIAYVEYEDEVSAAQAVLKTDGTTLAEKIISVAISNPPGRQKTETVASLGGGAKTFGARGRGRTQISFLPRTILLNTVPTTKGIEDLSITSPEVPATK